MHQNLPKIQQITYRVLIVVPANPNFLIVLNGLRWRNLIKLDILYIMDITDKCLSCSFEFKIDQQKC